MKKYLLLLTVLVVVVTALCGCTSNNDSKISQFNRNYDPNPSINKCAICKKQATVFIGKYYCDSCYDNLENTSIMGPDLSEILGKY